ncbi:hypothetical protein D3C79_929130 [compost metagenome]
MFDEVVPQIFLVEKVLVTVVFSDRFAGPHALRHGCELGCPALCVTGRAPPVCGMDGVLWVLRAVAVGRPAVAGHVLILAPEPAGRVDPAGNGLEAGGFGGFVHHDFFFAHGDSLAAISRQ